MSTRIKTLTMVLRDVGGTIVGLGGIIWMVVNYPPTEWNETALLILTVVSGIPGGAQLLSVISQMRNGSSPIELPSSPPAEPSSLPPSPSS